MKRVRIGQKLAKRAACALMLGVVSTVGISFALSWKVRTIAIRPGDAEDFSIVRLRGKLQPDALYVNKVVGYAQRVGTKYASASSDTITSVTVVHVGFPFRCMYYVLRDDDHVGVTTFGLDPVVVIGIDVLKPQPFVRRRTDGVLPTGIEPVAFVANAFLLTGVLLFILQLSQYSIRRRRVRNEQCLECGYALRGTTGFRCPECGEPRAESI